MQSRVIPLAAVLALAAACAPRVDPGVTQALTAAPPPIVSTACQNTESNFYYASGSVDLNRDALAELSLLQGRMANCNIDHVRIVGMAGSPGPENRNIELSRRRAEVVAAALAAGGWDRSRFEVIGVGTEGAVTGAEEVPIRRRVQLLVRASPRQ